MNSSAWGNYDNVTRTITSNKAKQRGTPWTAITGTKPAGAVLLTTGASEETNKMNIYDFAGNEYEWTLEHSTINEGNPCARRGGSYNSDGTKYSPADRGVDSIKIIILVLAFVQHFMAIKIIEIVEKCRNKNIVKNQKI